MTEPIEPVPRAIDAAEIHVRFSDCGRHIRQWDWQPFEGSARFVRQAVEGVRITASDQLNVSLAGMGLGGIALYPLYVGATHPATLTDEERREAIRHWLSPADRGEK